jgi:hypothetical protein
MLPSSCHYANDCLVAIQPYKKFSRRPCRSGATEEQYGLLWNPVQTQLSREFHMIRMGGQWQGKAGQTIGHGMEFHFKAMLKLIWPEEIVWHRWVDMFIHEFLTKRTVCVMGPAAVGKSYMSAFCCLAYWYVWPTKTTVLVCSTTREDLENRVWGMVKRLHKAARARHDRLPGYLIQSRQRIIYDEGEQAIDGQDFANGLVGVACRPGGSYVGLGSFAGIHNERVILLADEASLMPRVFVDAISNLDKAKHFICVAPGNPKETTDALGVLAEPAIELGGWDGGIDQQPHSKVYKTRRIDGVTLQLIGTECPNLDGKLGANLITQEQIDRDVSMYGRDSLWFTMMNQGMMPRGQGSRRVITRQECEKFGATKPADGSWSNSARTAIASLDAAYGGVGGDRCILCFAEFGEEMPPLTVNGDLNGSALVNQPKPDGQKRHLFALKETILVPIKTGKDEDTPTNQIALFCKQECEKRNIPPQHFIFDAGMRTALVQALSQTWSNKVVSLDSMGKASDRYVSGDIQILCKDYYGKFVSELWFSVRWTILSGQFRGLTDDAISEFSSREWTIIGANKTDIESKDKTKAKLGRSPDIADAICYAVELARRKGFVIKRIRPVEEPEYDDEWKRDARDKAKKFWRSGQLIEA